VIYSSKDVPNN